MEIVNAKGDDDWLQTCELAMREIQRVALQRAAEKIRRNYFGNGDPLGRHATTPITNAWAAANLIDPDKEDQ
jgi:hypothetical protein